MHRACVFELLQPMLARKFFSKFQFIFFPWNKKKQYRLAVIKASQKSGDKTSKTLNLTNEVHQQQQKTQLVMLRTDP